MFDHSNRARNALATIVRAASVRSSYILVPEMPDDRINGAIDRRIAEAREDQPDTASELPSSWGRFWLRSRRRAA